MVFNTYIHSNTTDRDNNHKLFLFVLQTNSATSCYKLRNYQLLWTKQVNCVLLLILFVSPIPWYLFAQQSHSEQGTVSTCRQLTVLTLKVLFKGVHSTLTKLIEWDQHIPAFTKLSLNNQVKLLKASWCEHYLLKIIINLETDHIENREPRGA